MILLITNISQIDCFFNLPRFTRFRQTRILVPATSLTSLHSTSQKFTTVHIFLHWLSADRISTVELPFQSQHLCYTRT